MKILPSGFALKHVVFSLATLNSIKDLIYDKRSHSLYNAMLYAILHICSGWVDQGIATISIQGMLRLLCLII